MLAIFKKTLLGTSLLFAGMLAAACATDTAKKTRANTRTNTVYITNNTTTFVTNHITNEQPKKLYAPWSIIGAKITDTYQGIQISEIIPGSPAARGGLKNGYSIFSIDGRTMDDTEAMIHYIRSRKPGTSLKIRLRHNDTLVERTVITTNFATTKQLFVMASSALNVQDYLRAGRLIKEYYKHREKTEEARKQSSEDGQKTKEFTDKYVQRFDKLKAQIPKHYWDTISRY